MLHLFATVLAVLVLAPAAAQSAAPPLELQPCRVDGVSGPAQCGVFRVHEAHGDRASKVLSLKVIVLQAKTPIPGAGPVFYFEGGPGQSATASAPQIADAWFRTHHDVVMLDQRGTTGDHRLDCDLPGSEGDVQGYLDQPYAAFAACGRTLSRRVDLTQYVTPVFVADVEALRQAMGYDRINLYGASYGSRAAMVYARTFPRQVRAMYVSGVVPFELRMPLYFPWSVQRAVDATLRLCAADPACRRAYPDPKADLAAVKARLAAAPAAVEIGNPATGRPEKVTLTEWGFVSAILWSLYAAGAPEDLPQTLEKARAGDYRALVEGWVASTHAGRGSMAWGVNRAINCSEDVPRIRPGEIGREAVGSFYGPTMGLATLELCKAWPKARYPKDFFAPAPSAVPTLITSGEFDPVTPPRWGEAARRSFPNSVHIVALYGHSQFREEGCLGAIATEFFREASVKGLDLSCAKTAGSRLQLLNP